MLGGWGGGLAHARCPGILSPWFGFFNIYLFGHIGLSLQQVRDQGSNPCPLHREHRVLEF